MLAWNADGGVAEFFPAVPIAFFFRKCAVHWYVIKPMQISHSDTRQIERLSYVLGITQLWLKTEESLEFGEMTVCEGSRRSVTGLRVY